MLSRQTISLLRASRRTFSSTSSKLNGAANMVAEHTFQPGTKVLEHPIDEPAKGISSIANFRAAATGVVPSGEAYSNMNGRRLTKQGAGKAVKGKKVSVNMVGENGMDWLDYDSFLVNIQNHLSEQPKIYVDDSRNIGALSANVITSDATTALMIHNAMEAVPKSVQGSNFTNGSKQVTIYAAKDVKESAAVVATEHGASKIILTGPAVSQTGLNAAIKAAVDSLAPPAGEDTE